MVIIMKPKNNKMTFVMAIILTIIALPLAVISTYRHVLYPSNNDILAFSELFKGNTNAYGVTEVGEIVDGKAQSKSTLIYGEVTPAVINRHLSGSLSIGLSPMQEDGTCFFGAIDIDDYKYDLNDVIAAIEDFNIPLCPCYSKSKKLHLYIKL